MSLTESVNVGYDPASEIESTSYTNRPAIPGDSITFQCSSGLVLSFGPSSSLCTDDGHWEPDPQELECVRIMPPVARCKL